MYTYVRIKNFLSLDDVTIKMKKTEKEVKKFIALYGENGSGKTNFVRAFEFLRKSVTSRINGNEIVNLQEEMQRVKTKDCKDDVELEFGFKIKDAEGFYYLKFNDVLKSEKLYYLGDKNRTTLFEINYENKKIIKNLNTKIFQGSEYKKELELEIDKYWGKNTFLSILVNEILLKNENYIKENISVNLRSVIDMFMEMSVIYFDSLNNEKGTITRKVGKLNMGLASGTIRADKYSNLEICNNVLRNFFVQTYADIKDVYYNIERVGDNIQYKLVFRKMIANKLIDIDYTKESTGTQRILALFNAIIGSMLGETIIIDEIDNGIHDLLIRCIINSIKSEITGQLIITTHNTLLLEDINKDEIYVIVTDYNGQKEINCISDYDIKIQKNHNLRDLYLKGAFGGVPFSEYVDFQIIKNDLNKFEDKKEIV